MLSVLVWLAMWGQGQKGFPLTRYQAYEQCLSASRGVDDGTCLVPTDECIDGDAIYKCDTLFSEPHNAAAKVPAGTRLLNGSGESAASVAEDTAASHASSRQPEHVIEIKTVRKRVKVLHYGETCPEHTSSRWIMSSDADAVCERVTRELWIDGVRWGIVKGLD